MRLHWTTPRTTLLIALASLFVISGALAVCLWDCPSERLDLEGPTLDKLDWNLVSLLGEAENLALRSDKVSFVTVWATWCPPCLREMPKIQNLHERFGEQMNFLCISAEDPGEVRRFAQQQGLTLPLYTTDDSPPQSLAIENLPTTFIISREGRLLFRHEGFKDWDDSGALSLIRQAIKKG